jgi:hypothetical protein
LEEWGFVRKVLTTQGKERQTLGSTPTLVLFFSLFELAIKSHAKQASLGNNPRPPVSI